MGINRIDFNGNTLIDLTTDTITDAAYGETYHKRDGTVGTGTMANGNNLAYGLTDRSLPIVGIGQVGSMII